jgi:hypothetical protein
MIKASFKLDWQGGAFSARLQGELRQAVQKSARLVRRAAVDLLNVTGKAATRDLNRSSSKAFKGLNKTQKNALIFSNGMAKIKGLKTIKSVKTGASLTMGGSHNGVKGIYWYGSPLNRWVSSSPAGSPPHKQSGQLQKIAVEYSQGDYKARIGPQQGLKYARIQELGGKGLIRLPPRPYMRPAFESQQEAIIFQFAMALQRAAK